MSQGPSGNMLGFRFNVRSISFSLYSVIIFISVFVLSTSFVIGHFKFSQVDAVESLSKQGWTLGRFPDDEVAVGSRVMSAIVSEHYLQPIQSVKAPSNFGPGVIARSSNDLKYISGIQVVILNGGYLNSDDIAAIAEITACQELDLRFCKYDASVTNLSIAISKLKNLRIIRLSTYGLQGDFIQSLGILENLSECEVVGIKLKPSDLEYLLSFPALRYLDIRLTGLDDETIRDVCRKTSSAAVVNRVQRQVIIEKHDNKGTLKISY